jgi:hypothetical protein
MYTPRHLSLKSMIVTGAALLEAGLEKKPWAATSSAAQGYPTDGWDNIIINGRIPGWRG